MDLGNLSGKIYGDSRDYHFLMCDWTSHTAHFVENLYALEPKVYRSIRVVQAGPSSKLFKPPTLP